LELFAIGPVFILFYVLIGAAGAGELNPEYDYANDYAVDDYPATVANMAPFAICSS
jgi:hypothetical protein